MTKRKLIKRATRIIKGSYKRLTHRFKYKNPYRTVFMAMGCQRSGTSILTHVFNRLDYSRAFGEVSIFTDQDREHKLRLNPLADVINQLSKINAPLIFIKPLVESQNASTLLSQIPRSKVIWVYRNHRDVASSDLKKFKNTNGVGNLIPIINDDQSNWRAQRVSESTREIIKKYFSESMAPPDAASLFWYTRNILFFEQNLADNRDVYLLKYEDFVRHPVSTINVILSDNDFPLADSKVANDVFTSSISKDKEINISKEIDELCLSLFNSLNEAAKTEEIARINFGSEQQ